MDHCTSLESVKDHFTSEVKKLQTCLLLRNCAEDDGCTSELKTIQADIDQISRSIRELRVQLSEEKEKIAALNRLTNMYRHLVTRLTYLLDHLPDRLPKPKKQITLENVQPLGDHDVSPVPKSETVCKSASGQQSNIYVPNIDYLTVEEFEKVPKYQKGRLTYDQVNKFIDGLNLAFQEKYKLMKMKKLKMKAPERKRYDVHVSQETKDTKGNFFVVDQDLMDYGALKLDKVTRNIIPLLRHCGRIKEIRGGKLTRYTYVDNY